MILTVWSFSKGIITRSFSIIRIPRNGGRCTGDTCAAPTSCGGEHLPPALAPTEDIDKDGCFSGSALVADGRLYLMYTGVVNRDGKSYQSQCLAYSEDG